MRDIKVYSHPTGNIPQMEMVSSILAAMRAGISISFIYDGKTRIVEPHAMGVSTKDGGSLLRGYQVAGEASRPLPQWTLFRLDKIEGLGATFTESHAPREGYKMGDAQMGHMIAELVTSRAFDQGLALFGPALILERDFDDVHGQLTSETLDYIYAEPKYSLDRQLLNI